MRRFLLGLIVAGVLAAQSDISAQLKALGLTPAQIETLLKKQKKQAEKTRKPQVTVPPESLAVEKPREYSIVEKVFMRKFSLEPDTELIQFGYDVFQSESTAFDTFTLNLPVGPSYVIGPGDEIIINAWSEVFQQTFDLFVDKYGKIILPKAGALYIRGLTFEEAKKAIISRLNKHFTNVKFDITLGQVHGSSVFVLGEVTKPGIYRTYPLSSPIQLLFMAKGVKKTGSLRNIKIVKRNGQTVSFDLYDVLLYGKKVPILTFEDGDVVFVPVIGEVVAVSGAVKRPGIYEIKREKSIYDIIQLAGGFLPTSYMYRVQVQRVSDSGAIRVEDLYFASVKEASKVMKKIPFKNGDLIVVSPVPPDIRGFVAITGNVYRPGKYEFNDTLKVKDLIELAGGVKRGTYMERAEIIRHADSLQKKIISFSLKEALSGEGPILREFDTVVIHSISDVIPIDSVTVIGGVAKPGKYQFTIDMTLADLLTFCGGIRAGSDISAVEILRLSDDGKFERLRIDMKQTDPTEVKLQPGDLVNIPPPVNLDSSYVYITGEVMRPGRYVVYPGKDRLIDVVNRAGGFTETANPAAIELYRKSLKNLEVSTIISFLDRVYTGILREEAALMSLNIPKDKKELRKELLKKQEKFVRMLLKNVGEDTLILLDTAKVETLSVILSKITPMSSGRLSLNLRDSADFNVLVLPGDSIYVPPQSRTVTVMGFVNYPVSVPHVPGMDARFYIEKAGGYSSIADKERTFVVLPGGEATTDLTNIPAGSIIMVPGKTRIKPSRLEILKDVVGIVYQIALAYIAIRQVTK